MLINCACIYREDRVLHICRIFLGSPKPRGRDGGVHDLPDRIYSHTGLCKHSTNYCLRFFIWIHIRP